MVLLLQEVHPRNVYSFALQTQSCSALPKTQNLLRHRSSISRPDCTFSPSLFSPLLFSLPLIRAIGARQFVGEGAVIPALEKAERANEFIPL